MSNEELREKINKEIETYTMKYSIKHGITIEEARKHLMVQIAESYYKKGQLQ